jgi:nitric oxide reductase NorE protein
MNHATTNAPSVAAAERPDNRKAARAGYLPGEPSMWFFIIGDLLIFGVYFICYMVYRGQNPEMFLQSQQQLNQNVGVVNTVVLLTSSLFVALGTEAAREHKLPDAFALFGLALVIGGAFPVLKMIEWIPEISAGLTPGKNLFFMFYYVMTGLHLVHVLAGLTIMGFVMGDLRASAQPSIRFAETGAMYWHMVDVLWLVLFAVFYLMR